MEVAKLHELIKEFQVENIVSAIGGFLILIYSLFFVLKKVMENLGWAKEKRQKKENEKKKQRQEEFDEFFAPYKEQIDQILKDLQQQNLSQMRIEMDKIYELYRHDKKIPRQMRTEFLRLYEIYIARGGNHYICDIIYPELMSWEIID